MNTAVCVCCKCRTLEGLVGLAADQRSSLTDEWQQSLKQDGSRQAGRLQQSVYSDLLQRRTEPTVSEHIRGVNLNF